MWYFQMRFLRPYLFDSMPSVLEKFPESWNNRENNKKINAFSDKLDASLKKKKKKKKQNHWMLIVYR